MKRAEKTLSMSESNKENQPSAAKKPRTGKTGKTGKKQSNSKKPRKQTKKPSKEKQKKPRKNEVWRVGWFSRVLCILRVYTKRAYMYMYYSTVHGLTNTSTMHACTTCTFCHETCTVYLLYRSMDLS